MAVLLLVLACGGEGDGFEPAPGATLDQDELEGLMDAAVAFSRAFVAAGVDVVAVDGKVSDSLADDIAEALDEQIKAALSR